MLRFPNKEGDGGYQSDNSVSHTFISGSPSHYQRRLPHIVLFFLRWEKL